MDKLLAVNLPKLQSLGSTGVICRIIELLVVKGISIVCVSCLAADKFPYFFFHTANNLPFIDGNFFIN